MIPACDVCHGAPPDTGGVCRECLEGVRRRQAEVWLFRAGLFLLLLVPAIPWSVREMREIVSGPPRPLEAWIAVSAGLVVHAAWRWLGWRRAPAETLAARAREECKPPDPVPE